MATLPAEITRVFPAQSQCLGPPICPRGRRRRGQGGHRMPGCHQPSAPARNKWIRNRSRYHCQQPRRWLWDGDRDGDSPCRGDRGGLAPGMGRVATVLRERGLGCLLFPAMRHPGSNEAGRLISQCQFMLISRGEWRHCWLCHLAGSGARRAGLGGVREGQRSSLGPLPALSRPLRPRRKPQGFPKLLGNPPGCDSFPGSEAVWVTAATRGGQAGNFGGRRMGNMDAAKE